MLDLTGFRGLDEEIIVDSSEGKRQYLIISPTGGHIKLAPGAYRLVKGIHCGRRFEALAREFSEKGGQLVSPSEIEAAHTEVAAQISSIINREGGSALPSAFWFRFQLIPASIVARVSSLLSVAFHPVVAVLLLGFIVVSFGVMLAEGMPLNIEGGGVWLGYFLFVLSLVFHEFGHASACARYGAKPSDIGFTFYLIFPAFYSDVTEAWQLKRWERVVVDLGGTYLQFVFVGALVTAYFATGWEALRMAFVMSWYGALFSLNPIFKFDGYWVLADALGVTNLSKQPSTFAKYFIDSVRGKNPAALPWPNWLILVLSIYPQVALENPCFIG